MNKSRYWKKGGYQKKIVYKRKDSNVIEEEKTMDNANKTSENSLKHSVEFSKTKNIRSSNKRNKNSKRMKYEVMKPKEEEKNMPLQINQISELFPSKEENVDCPIEEIEFATTYKQVEQIQRKQKQEKKDDNYFINQSLKNIKRLKSKKAKLERKLKSLIERDSSDKDHIDKLEKDVKKHNKKLILLENDLKEEKKKDNIELTYNNLKKDKRNKSEREAKRNYNEKRPKHYFENYLEDLIIEKRKDKIFMKGWYRACASNQNFAFVTIEKLNRDLMIKRKRQII